MPDPDVTWKEYVDAQDKSITDITNARLNGFDRAISVALDANATAISKAEQATEYRLAGMNEFRQSLNDQTAQFATKTEIESIRNEIKGLSKQVYIITGALAAVQVLLQFLPK